MHYKTDEQLRQYLEKKVERDIGRRLWSFNGINFQAWSGYFEGDFYTRAEYTCDLMQLSVRLSRGNECCGDFEIIAEQVFKGENAIFKCITWVVDKLTEIYKLLNERLAPYIFKKDLYDREVRRPIELKEG